MHYTCTPLAGTANCQPIVRAAPNGMGAVFVSFPTSAVQPSMFGSPSLPITIGEDTPSVGGVAAEPQLTTPAVQAHHATRTALIVIALAAIVVTGAAVWLTRRRMART